MKEISIKSVIPCFAKDVPGTPEGRVKAQEGPEPRSGAQVGGLASETRRYASPSEPQTKEGFKITRELLKA